MHCPNCGATIDDNVKFCRFCGAQTVKKFCKNCGTSLSESDSVCPACNTPCQNGNSLCPPTRSFDEGESDFDGVNSSPNTRDSSPVPEISDYVGVPTPQPPAGKSGSSQNVGLKIAIAVLSVILVVGAIVVGFFVLGKGGGAAVTTEESVTETNSTEINTTAAPTTTTEIYSEVATEAEAPVTKNYGKLAQPNNEFSYYYSSTVNCKKTGLNMRYGPSTKYKVILVIPNHATVTVCGMNEGNSDWMYVNYQGKYGWVSSDYLADDLP